MGALFKNSCRSTEVGCWYSQFHHNRDASSVGEQGLLGIEEAPVEHAVREELGTSVQERLSVCTAECLLCMRIGFYVVQVCSSSLLFTCHFPHSEGCGCGKWT